jgi:hypothetical protein
LFLSSFLFTADVFVKLPGAGIKKATSYTTNDVINHNTAIPTINHDPAPGLQHKPAQTNDKVINLEQEPAHANISNVINNAHDISIHFKPRTANKIITPLQSISRNDPPPARSRGAYIGLLSGPEFNEVKSQGLQKTGFDIGVIAGYRFSRKFSVETGLFFSKKYYFTEGKHFNMEMPGMKVLSLEGSCAVLEIPLRAKYTVFAQRKSAIFSTAGISSYLMMNEKNNYLISTSGTQQSMVASYDERCRYFAATIDVSVGYEHTLGTRTNLRIAPYLQLPMKGIGVGTLPVKSAGVHIGITRSFH